EALAVLTKANRTSPADRDILIALVTINRDAGNSAAAASFARALQERWPLDPQARALIKELEP
ncbi:MAG: hypothetical protein GVY09_14750, partial [Gammaproteobacteria bacterium]|nr:hypothetical protein [Gammaproteobacteria bacterium]